MEGFAGYQVSHGGKVTGPFSAGQIWSMWKAGKIKPEAQVRADHSEIWEDIHTLICRWAPDTVRRKENKTGARILGASVIVATLLIVLFIVFADKIARTLYPNRFALSRASEEKVAQGLRDQEIQQWAEKTLGQSSSRTISTGSLHRQVKGDTVWMDVTITDKSKPAGQPGVKYRVTFDKTNKIIETKEITPQSGRQ